jgi:adenylosuccinate lyase
MQGEIFANLNPSYLSDPESAQDLSKCLFEEAFIDNGMEVEATLVRVLVKQRAYLTNAVAQVEEALRQITPREVYLVAKNTRHNILALEN